MSKRIVWSDRARRDIDGLKRFYDERNGSNRFSKRLLALFNEAVHFIAEHPNSMPLTDFPNVRCYMILDYSILYEELEHEILILTVWDNRRDPEALQKLMR